MVFVLISFVKRLKNLPTLKRIFSKYLSFKQFIPIYKIIFIIFLSVLKISYLKFTVRFRLKNANNSYVLFTQSNIKSKILEVTYLLQTEQKKYISDSHLEITHLVCQ